MENRNVWDESCFDEMSWHDNHVHGLRLREGPVDAGWRGQLELDLDYILEWMRPTESTFAFRVAPATLTFVDVLRLRIDIDYAAPGAATTPFAIDAITRVVAVDGVRWTIALNWPKGEISFDASGFRQALRGPARLTSSQSLTEQERAPVSEA